MSVRLLPAFYNQVQPFIGQPVVRLTLKSRSPNDGPKCHQQPDVRRDNAVQNIVQSGNFGSKNLGQISCGDFFQSFWIVDSSAVQYRGDWPKLCLDFLDGSFYCAPVSNI